MNSDMSKRMSAPSEPKRKPASARASSVFPTPVGPRKMKLPDRPVRALQPGARPPDRPRQRRDRLILADDPAVQRVFHLQQLVPLVLRDRRERHARPLRHDLVDLRLADLDAPLPRAQVEPLAHHRHGLAHRVGVPHGPLPGAAPRPGAAGVRFRGGRLVGRSQRRVPGLARVAELGPRAGLVDQVDRLVGEEPIGDVAARLETGGVDRLAGVLDPVERLVAVLHAEQDVRSRPARTADRPSPPGTGVRANGPSRCASGTPPASSTRCSGSRPGPAPASGCWPRRATPRPSRRRPACAARR